MTTALIDADIVAYRCAASCEKQGTVVEHLDVGLVRVKELMERIIYETSSHNYVAYLTGSSNYRYQYNPQYKANRKDTPKPHYLQPIREYLITNWKAELQEGQEADDALGIYQCANIDTIICTIDKDLLMIPGNHYNFIKGEFYEQSEHSAIQHFYWQLVMGDRSDNIFGFDGKARHKVPAFLEPVMDELASYSNELDMFSFVRSLYNDDELLLSNGRCLWIRRKPDEIWEFPV